MLYINFISKYLNKNYLAIFELLKISKRKESIGLFDRITFMKCEQYILSEALVTTQNGNEGFDYAQYIEGNNQQI